MPATNPSALALSESDRQVLDTWLAEFDRSWHCEALAERVQELSALPAALHFPALVEMVKLDLGRQWQQGRRLSLESYLEAHTRLGTPYTVPADLIQAEYEARQRLGETPDLADFAQRFPGRIDELRRLLNLARETTSLAAEQQRQATPPPPLVTSPSGPSQPIQSAGSLPEQFGRYRIIRKLGQGGMGTVYLAHDAQFDRPVALKVPHFSADDGPEVIERFYREARRRGRPASRQLLPGLRRGRDRRHSLPDDGVPRRPVVGGGRARGTAANRPSRSPDAYSGRGPRGNAPAWRHPPGLETVQRPAHDGR